ncbi:HesA/MoeB/ThiF family protein [Chitinophaga silvatica]|uniref:HesA/MoeB/ThiF family protein n=1 Tax=Chitinophaga silvatica TaxID=2282649 RepID=A0A3E1YD76_9BACT|nr:HesA/MoeB/ThiF family protein [Chitinophaga silvatica]RFS24471.1 HesA/MoeB/ThiF family protein [Chitinophaga silvatica]
MILSEKELQHFKLPIAVPGMGVSMQEKLKEARVLVVGAGGLGSPVIQYLSASGVGVIGIADYGVINDEDMPRQPIYQMQDVRKHKAKMAASRLWAVNPYTKHYPILMQVKPETIAMMLVGFDLVIDCSQHRPTHLVVNDACIVHNKPFIIGEVHNWLSWFAGFNMPQLDGGFTASYRCASEQAESYRNFDAGAIGITHGATGIQMACEAIKYIMGIQTGIAGKFYGTDYLHKQTTVLELQADNAAIESVRTAGVLTADEYGLEIVPDVED